jgi:pseudouridine-5'-phosphate glycosidase
VDVRFDDERALAEFLKFELNRTGRGVLVCNPVPAEDALDPGTFASWLGEAEEEARGQGIRGRAVTPFVLGRLHERSGGRTLKANLALVRSNTRLAARLARQMAPKWSEVSPIDA